ncbi:lytic murein transglycosylase [Salibaculum sp.]|uniref:lytic murein transglycosylase n=1 Tax=Salibaculum sp. TaxID=2855480 RepID=UPI002B47DB5A|nr:lytic murein transglycosylase [Salibaculum sp.]HKL70965.1 lytic murein transglycosylase [Salibaculum sp.]
MTATRRQMLTLLAAWSLASCGAGPVPAQDAQALPADLRPQPNAAFDAWVSGFRGRAASRGISPATLEAGLADAGYLPGVVRRDASQIQTRRTFEDYLSIATSDARLAKGRAAMRGHGDTVAAIEGRFGVSRHVVAAIWGVESEFGDKRGRIPVVSATATLAFDGRRGAFWEDQLLAALRILQAGETTPDKLRGSWAGAMGHTQFIPTSYLAFAVDFDSDGRRDIWGDDPGDALASTASYLARNGWRGGLAWGEEAVAGTIAGRTIRPQAGGPRFTVTRNFDVLKHYNNSDFYAAAVGHLADRLAGGGPLRGDFPPDANGLTRADRIAVQRTLAARGFDVGTIDGVIGPLTEAAIRDFETAQGLEVTGQANRALLARLR